MSHKVKAITIKKSNNKLPVVLNKRIILKKELLPFKDFKGNVKLVKSVPFQEDVLYETRPGDFLCGDAHEIVIVNRLNKRTNSCRTIAKCKSQSGQVFEKTSDDVAKLIGQSNYDTLFSALCSVISQELKIRGIYSLLTVPKPSEPIACQDEDVKKKLDSQNVMKDTREFVEVHCQTEESYIAVYKSSKMKRRAKRSQPAPYVVRETTPVSKKPRRVVIPPCNFGSILKSTSEAKQEESQKDECMFPELKGSMFDDDSNHSTGRLSGISVATTPELLNNPMSLIMAIDKVTESIQKDTRTLHDFDSGKLVLDTKKPAPSNQVLQNMPRQQRIKMLLQQGLYDFQNCLQRDESDHLPIHVAVLHNDLDLLKRQCLVLKMKGASVDIPADNLTPLKMSLYQDNVQMTSLLLQYNADILDCDAQDRTYFHMAAEMPTDHLKVLINHCQHNARKILEDSEALWMPAFATRTDTDLANILLTYVSKLTNDQGYTPLMMACKLGIYENVKLLVEGTPETVNYKMPSSGNTALYLAVGSACMNCIERGNKSKVVDHFRKTIEILVENGADPNSKNFDGTNVNDLLTEYNIADLSMLIANKMTCRNLGDGKIPPGKQFDSFMLIKDEAGNLDFKNIEKPPKKTKTRVPKAPSKISPGKNVDAFIIIKDVAGNVDLKNIEKPQKKTKRVAKTPKKTAASPGADIPMQKSPKKPIIIKSETITGDNAICPSISTIRNNITGSIRKQPGILNSILKPLILKSVLSKNKTNLEITCEPNETSKTND